MSETALLNAIRLDAVKLGCTLWRNNVGRLRTDKGTYIQFGLCVGSSDLVGFTMIDGRAIFTAIEVKMPRKKPTKEQIAFVDAVVKAGGIATVAYSIDGVKDAIAAYDRMRR